MSLSTSLVEVRTITCDQPRSNFDQQTIEQAAKSIVAAEGIINPIIVRRTGINSFKVIEGDFEYHAAARARELNLEIGEAIAAYIIEGDNEELIKEQIAIFRGQPDPTPTIPSDNHSITNVNNLETRLTNIESRIENRLIELKSEYTQKNKELKLEIKEIRNKIPDEIEPLTTFNQASLNELTIKLKLALRSDKKANDIASKIAEARPFKSLIEVIDKVNGLGDKTMLRIVDNWLYP
ncbi:MAG: ParB N-terminal domain-containing protein [Cyanobacteria bacterium P01_G01_bin.39]